MPQWAQSVLNGPNDPLYGTTLGVNPSYATRQSIFDAPSSSGDGTGSTYGVYGAPVQGSFGDGMPTTGMFVGADNTALRSVSVGSPGALAAGLAVGGMSGISAAAAALTSAAGAPYDSIAMEAANAMTEPGQSGGTSNAGGGIDPIRVNDLAPSDVRASGGNRSLLYANGQGFPVAVDTRADGRILTTFADGYSVSAQDGGHSVFAARNMSDMGPTLSNADYQAVVDRASALQWGTDSSALYHSVAGFFDNLFGIQPNPMRTPDQEAELADLQGMISARVTTDPLQASYPVLAARLDAAAGGPVGGLTVLGTQDWSPTNQYFAARTAGSADGVLTAFGTAYAARGLQGFVGTSRSELEPANSLQAETVGGFNPATSTGLEYTSKSLGENVLELTSRQKFDAAGNVVPAIGVRSEAVTTFNPNSGDMFINFYRTTETGRGVGTELISNSIQNFGPQNVQSISAELGLTNKSIFEYNMSSEGMSPISAASNTPLGKSLISLGYRQIEVNGLHITARLGN